MVGHWLVSGARSLIPSHSTVIHQVDHMHVLLFTGSINCYQPRCSRSVARKARFGRKLWQLVLGL